MLDRANYHSVQGLVCDCLLTLFDFFFSRHILIKRVDEHLELHMQRNLATLMCQSVRKLFRLIIIIYFLTKQYSTGKETDSDVSASELV